MLASRSGCIPGAVCDGSKLASACQPPTLQPPHSPLLPTPPSSATPLVPPTQALHTLAEDGRTVVFCIHQPRSSIFDMFDQLLLISEGRLCYRGPADSAAAHFAAAGHPCPPGHSVADFLLDVTSVDFRSPEAEASSRQRVRDLADLCAAQGGAAGQVRSFAWQPSIQGHSRVLHLRRCLVAGAATLPTALPAMQEPGPGAQLVAAAPTDEQPAEASSCAEEDELPKFANNPLREFQLLLGRVGAALQLAGNAMLVKQLCVPASRLPC